MAETDCSGVIMPSIGQATSIFAISLIAISKHILSQSQRFSNVATSPGCIARIIVSSSFRFSSAAMCYAELV